MKLTILRVSEDAEFDAVFRIRKQVFVVEQGVAEEEEWDEFEHIAKHYLAVSENEALGTARWRRTLSGDYKLERFAVVKEMRGQGVGKALVEAVLADVPRDPTATIYLHAQLSAQPFYEKLGFQPVGEIFDEAGIQHVKMKYAEE